MNFIKKLILTVVTLTIVALLSLTLTGCPPAPPVVEETTTEEEITPEEEVVAAAVETLKIVYLTPSTDSGYWGVQVAVGVENAIVDIKKEYGVEVEYEMVGPVQEQQFDIYISTLEAVIAKQPDGIAMGQLNPDAVAPLVKEATEKGIRVNLISIGVEPPLTGEQYGQLFYCDQPEQGKMAAEAYVAALQEKGLPLNGVTGVHMSIVIPILEEKINMFVSTLQELAPDMTILETQYNENDITKGIGLMESQLATHGDKLVGFFGGNNVTGDAIVKVIEESGRADSLVGIAVDADPLEVEGLRKGYLDGLVVQTPYDQAYNATMGIAEFVLEGIDGSDSVNMPASVVTPANMDTPEMQALLDPTILKYEEE